MCVCVCVCVCVHIYLYLIHTHTHTHTHTKVGDARKYLYVVLEYSVLESNAEKVFMKNVLGYKDPQVFSTIFLFCYLRMAWAKMARRCYLDPPFFKT